MSGLLTKRGSIIGSKTPMFDSFGKFYEESMCSIYVHAHNFRYHQHEVSVLHKLEIIDPSTQIIPS